MAERAVKGGSVFFFQDRVQIDGEWHPVRFAGPEKPPGPGITVEPYVITDELENLADAAKIRVEPGYATPIELFNGDRWIQDFFLKGKGKFLAADPNGTVHLIEFNSSSSDDVKIAEYQKGWTMTWVADKDGDGLEIIEVCSPPWVPEYEILDPTDSRLPDEFKDIYRRITS